MEWSPCGTTFCFPPRTDWRERSNWSSLLHISSTLMAGEHVSKATVVVIYGHLFQTAQCSICVTGRYEQTINVRLGPSVP